MPFSPLNLPPYPFRITLENGVHYIFDEIRKKHLVLTPEEWVRQHFVKYLVSVKNYPQSLIRQEGGLTVNTLKKRSDILVYNTRGEKILIIECKAPSVKITQAAFDQVARYNSIHKVPLVVVTNGIDHHYCEIDFNNDAYRFIPDLPEYTPAT